MKLDTLYDDESITSAPLDAEAIVEDMLDSRQLKRILMDMLAGELSDRVLARRIFDLAMHIENTRG